MSFASIIESCVLNISVKFSTRCECPMPFITKRTQLNMKIFRKCMTNELTFSVNFCKKSTPIDPCDIPLANRRYRQRAERCKSIRRRLRFYFIREEYWMTRLYRLERSTGNRASSFQFPLPRRSLSSLA